MTFFAGVDRAGFVEAQFEFFSEPANDGIGPPSPIPVGEYTYYEIPAMSRGARPSKTSLLMWVNGAMVWVEQAALADSIAAALDKPRADINAVVWDAVGNLTEEYKDAEADARAYKAAGYTGTVPPSVDCFAQHNPTGSVQTGRWAADDIIMRADAFAAAKLAMRERRFASQSAMRAATTPAELSAAVAGWDSFIAQLRAQLGL